MLVKWIHPQKVLFMTARFLILDGNYVVNPTDEQIRNAGYKPLVPLTERPIGKNAAPVYAEEEDRVTVTWLLPEEETADD